MRLKDARIQDTLSSSTCQAHFAQGPSRTEAEHHQPRFDQIDGATIRNFGAKKKSAPERSHALPLDRCISDADPPGFFTGDGRSTPSLALRNQLHFRSAAGPQGDSITTLPSAFRWRVGSSCSESPHGTARMQLRSCLPVPGKPASGLPLTGGLLVVLKGTAVNPRPLVCRC